MISTPTHQLLELSQLAGVGPATLRRVWSDHKSQAESIEDVAFRMPTIANALDDARVWAAAKAKAQTQVDAASSEGFRIVSPADADYPSLLASTKDDPFLLFVKGHFAEDQNKSVAIIGTREPTEHGVVIAERLTDFFVRSGWSVVSGLALGCDAVAHKRAVASGGHTVAVLAHGLQTIAPAKHKSLAAEIVESGGALVSQYSFGTPAIPQNFVQRDMTQAGLASGVVMVQSDLKGGSLHASRAILRYGRWLAIPYPTERDRLASESKIQANLVLADGTPAEKMALLRTQDPQVLSQLLLLKSKDDYERCLVSPSMKQPEAQVHQTSMF